MLAIIKVATLKIGEKLRKRLSKVVRENLDAYATSSTDVDRNKLVIDTINTGDARLNRHKLRLIPFAMRQYEE